MSPSPRHGVPRIGEPPRAALEIHAVFRRFRIQVLGADDRPRVEILRITAAAAEKDGTSTRITYVKTNAEGIASIVVTRGQGVLIEQSILEPRSWQELGRIKASRTDSSATIELRTSR